MLNRRDVLKGIVAASGVAAVWPTAAEKPPWINGPGRWEDAPGPESESLVYATEQQMEVKIYAPDGEVYTSLIRPQIAGNNGVVYEIPPELLTEQGAYSIVVRMKQVSV